MLFSINVHPNPAINSLFLNSNFNINSFILSDINGRTLIYENNINKKSFEIDISSLKSGIYFLKNFSGKQLQTIKILKRWFEIFFSNKKSLGEIIITGTLSSTNAIGPCFISPDA